MNVLLLPMIINEKTHFGGFVPLPKWFQRYFCDDLAKSIFRLKIACLKHFTRKSLRRTIKKIGKCDFSKMNVLLLPIIIFENTHLEGFVSLPKRFQRYFRDDLSKSFFFNPEMHVSSILHLNPFRQDQKQKGNVVLSKSATF